MSHNYLQIKFLFNKYNNQIMHIVKPQKYLFKAKRCARNEISFTEKPLRRKSTIKTAASPLLQLNPIFKKLM